MDLQALPRWCELRAGGADDPDAARSAAVLGAYFEVEECRAHRRLVSRGGAMVVLAGWTVALATPVLTRIDLMFGAGLLGAAVLASAAAEWRARIRLSKLVG